MQSIFLIFFFCVTACVHAQVAIINLGRGAVTVTGVANPTDPNTSASVAQATINGLGELLSIVPAPNHHSERYTLKGSSQPDLVIQNNSPDKYIKISKLDNAATAVRVINNVISPQGVVPITSMGNYNAWSVDLIIAVPSGSPLLN